jgi:hypothetical protein
MLFIAYLKRYFVYLDGGSRSKLITPYIYTPINIRVFPTSMVSMTLPLNRPLFLLLEVIVPVD